MIKLVVTDVDGTIVGNSKMNLNPEYYDVIRALTAKGIQVVIASGRQYESIRKIMEPVQDLVWYIADSGATIKTDKGFENTGEIPHDILRRCIIDVRNIPNMTYFLSTSNKAYVPEINTPMYDSLTYELCYLTEYVENLDSVPEYPISKLTLFREVDVEYYAYKYLSPRWEDKLHMAKSGEMWIDCLLPGINKATALKVIMEHLGVTRYEVLATGDNQNDIEMVKMVGKGLAVANAHPDLIAVADAIIPSYEEDGVLLEWKKLL